LIKVRFSITSDDGKTELIYKTWAIPVQNVHQFKHRAPLSFAFTPLADQFWESCILMGLVVKD